MDTLPYYYVELVNLVAKSYEGRDMRRLSSEEQDIVAILITHGHIVQKVPANGFVGTAVEKTKIA
jgi:hypothetical protein